jgi:hypothetical protein
LDSIQFSYQDAIENAVAANEDAPFELDTEFEHLADFIRHPLSINFASADDFAKLRLLSSIQIQAIIQHRVKYGLYISLYELQSVLDLETIHKILPFITVEGALDDYQMPIRDWFSKGKFMLFTRWERRLEQAEGYKRPYTEGGYHGDRNKLYARLRYTFGNHLSYGFTLEKDAGETFGKSVFDFWSAHFKINKSHKSLKTILIGDFTAHFGQGLILENGFNIGKNALVLNIEKKGIPVRAYTSANETNFQRGIAAQVQLGKNTEGVVFASYRRRDANLVASPDNSNLEFVASSLLTSGLHRSDAEITDRKQIALMTFGAMLKQTFKRGAIGLNVVFNHFDRRLEPRFEPYNIHAFRGRSLGNLSIDYDFRPARAFQNFHLFGESAVSDNGGYAILNGLLLGLDKRFSLSVLHRAFGLQYQALQAQAFSESNRVQDERGFYLGFEFKPHRRWIVSSYADFWRHDWWRFRVDGASQGMELFSKITYRQRHTEGYLQMRWKLKPQNASNRPDAIKVNEIVAKAKTQIRLHGQYRFSPYLECRNRLEWSFYDDQKFVSRGFAIWQDILFSFPQRLETVPLDSALSFSKLSRHWQKLNHIFFKILRGSHWSTRLAYFDTNDYSSAIYAFENDLLYNFTILPYYFRGSRFYINARFKIWEDSYLEARFAQTFLANKKSFGDGLDKIEGQMRSDIKLQWRLAF